MRGAFASALFIAAGYDLAFARPGQQPYERTVNTSSGSIRGFVDGRYPDVTQFLGIPYAAAPVKDLRYQPPQRYSSKGTFHAKHSPKACPQYTTTIPTVYSVSTPQFLNQNPWSEDCLLLSVFTPSCALTGDEKLPVLVFLHGGGLVSGSASVPYQQPQPWIQRSKEHIVVLVQYRLGIFGFPNAAGLDDNNLGILDQRMAIEWVRDNAAGFGGDPERIVLWGQSAGSASIDAQNFAFPEDPVVSGFIQDSGTALVVGNGFGLFTNDPSHSNFTFVANHFGCSTSPQRQVECMRAIDANRIITFIANHANDNTQPPLFFIGTPDERIVFSNYTERYLRGNFSDRPAVLGTNTQEGELIAPFPADPSRQGPNATLAENLTLELFQCPAGNSAGLREGLKRKTYRYIYAGNFTDVSPLFWEGAYHATELPQVFGTRGHFRSSASAYEVQTSDAMQDLWLGFAKNPQNPEQYGWKEADTQFMLQLGAAGGPAVKVINESIVDTPCKKAGLSLF